MLAINKNYSNAIFLIDCFGENFIVCIIIIVQSQARKPNQFHIEF